MIKECWHNIFPETNDCDDEEENIPLSVLKLQLNDEDAKYAQFEGMNILNLRNSKVIKLNLCLYRFLKLIYTCMIDMMF